MLFNSFIFIFAFLPLTLAGFFTICAVMRGRVRRRVAVALLVAASLVYYGWWNPVYLWLIGASIAVNYSLGLLLGRAAMPRVARGATLAAGVVFNLGLLGYFKYAGFFARTIEALSGLPVGMGDIVLPLAISFFTFQQIAYLADAYADEAHEYSLLDYCLFVTFFPQLIAGPIVHHGEMLPQFEREETYHLRASNLAAGLAFFTIGLFKKVVIADGVAPIASLVFDAAAEGRALTTFDAWAGALAYTAQLYFDFSGYSDMAIGLGRLFGIRLPVNFNSPYKAVNIIEFWRRWHMTLSRFLRDYLYIPLGGNRRGRPRRYLNLMITMLLGGLWHGAAWTFVVWGAVHGLLLCVNHGFHALRRLFGVPIGAGGAWGAGLSRAVTMLAVIVAWVPFRAPDFASAWSILAAMSGAVGLSLGSSVSLDMGDVVLPVGVALAIALFAPNSNEIMAGAGGPLGWAPEPGRASRLQWRPTGPWALAVATGFTVSVVYLSRASEFLYYQF